MWRWCLKHDAFPSFDDANGNPPWSCVPVGTSHSTVCYADTAEQAVSNAMAATIAAGGGS